MTDRTKGSGALLTMVVGCALCGFAYPPSEPRQNYLSEDQVIDLMRNPREWDQRILTIRIYPYDNGFGGSYVACFEPCDEAYAQSSPFIVITRANRFSGYRGDRPVVITASYSSACFYRRPVTCADFRYGQFTEIEPQ